ncbi:MAG: hypothetical protein ACW99U_12925 [Candidatus Thorarchaeota archaeon]|jgi:hypothetical protein
MKFTPWFPKKWCKPEKRDRAPIKQELLELVEARKAKERSLEKDKKDVIGKLLGQLEIQQIIERG